MRLLAITPPAALVPRIDPETAQAWIDGWIRAGALELGLAVLLREPGAGIEASLADPRLAALRLALAEAGIPALLSVDPKALAQGPAVLAARPALAGVQLRGDPSLAALGRWRDLLGERILGRSCHGATPEPDQPAPQLLDYSCVAPVFTPRTGQPGVDKRAIGLEALGRWTAAVPRVIALGGVSVTNAQACLVAGATGLAGISLFFGQSAAAPQDIAALCQLSRRSELAGSRAEDHVSQARQRR